MTSGALVADHVYAAAGREEVWIIPGNGRPGHLVVRRDGHGRAVTTSAAGTNRIEASDHPSPTGQSEALIATARHAFETELVSQFESIPSVASLIDRVAPLRLILRGNASIVWRNAVETARTSLFVTASIQRMEYLSVVTTAQFLRQDLEMLSRSSPSQSQASVDARHYPLLWRNGTGAVLMHEAIGHAAEHGAPKIAWPDWLRVEDVPDAVGGVSMLGVDDTGEPVELVDLTAGRAPSARRRTAFSDLPIPRMTNVVVRHVSAPWSEPVPRIEISLVGGGRYEALDDRVTIAVVIADLVTSSGAERLRPFDLSESREDIAHRLAGATGDPHRYPGVICSSEGQELFVGSFAADLHTSAMAS